jgi:hypothetical protein
MPAARGVGHCSVSDDEDAITSVRGTDGSCGDTVPLRIKPDRGQISEDFFEPATEQAGDVFEDNPLWSDGVDDSGHFWPQPSGVVLRQP